MGIEKFYKVINNRYPHFSIEIGEDSMIPIDHLYLDITGIFHISKGD
jgi:5'-3' exonuclease